VTYSSVLYVAVVDAVSGDVPGTAGVWRQATPDIDSANYAFAAQGNFLRLSSSIQAETSLSSSSGTMRLAVAKNSLLYGAYPIAPQGIQTGSTFPNYIVDSQAVDASSSLELSTTSFLTPAWNSGGGGATVEVKASGVTTAKIADRAVTNIKLANTTGSEAVSTGVIRDSAVTTAKLADSSVTSAKILDGTIATGDIAAGAITQPLLSASAVGETNISPYLTTGTLSPSSYLPATKIVSANTTVSGTSISTTNTAVDAQALRNGLNGWSVPNGLIVPNSSRSSTSNQVFLNRFYAPIAITASKITVHVLTASATSTDWFDVGIFSATGTLLASTGQTTGINAIGTITATLGAGTGAKTGSANYALTAGTTYYIGIMTSLTSGTVNYSASGSGGAPLYGTAAGQWLMNSSTASGTTTSINAATIPWPTASATTSIGQSVFFVLRTD
jgi:hypothetical protein